MTPKCSLEWLCEVLYGTGGGESSVIQWICAAGCSLIDAEGFSGRRGMMEGRGLSIKSIG